MLLAPIKVVFFLFYTSTCFITDDLIYICFLYMWLLTHTSLICSCVTIVTTFLSQPLHAGPTLLEQLHNVSLQRKVLQLKRRCYWHSERIFFCLWCCYCCCFFHWCFNFELLCFCFDSYLYCETVHFWLPSVACFQRASSAPAGVGMKPFDPEMKCCFDLNFYRWYFVYTFRIWYMEIQIKKKN